MQAACAAGQIFLTIKHLFSALRSGWWCCAVHQAKLSPPLQETRGAAGSWHVIPQSALKTVRATLHLASSLSIVVWELKRHMRQKSQGIQLAI